MVPIGAHYPLDIVGGWASGTGFMLLGGALLAGQPSGIDPVQKKSNKLRFFT